MENLKLFKRMIDEEVVILGDNRFTFDYAVLESLNTANFYFKLGTMTERFNLDLDFLNSDDELFMIYNAVKLVDRAYHSLIRKTQYDYGRVLRNLVDLIEDVVKKSPINDFEITSVDYRFSIAFVNFKIFGLDEKFEIDLNLMESFDGSEKYAEYVAARVINRGAQTLIDNAKKGI